MTPKYYTYCFHRPELFLLRPSLTIGRDELRKGLEMTTLSLPGFGLLAVPLTGLYLAAALAQEIGPCAAQPYRFHPGANVIVWLQCRQGGGLARWSIEAD